ncbi:glycosyltransferase [Aureimonas glaciei]|uniref:Glycosyl transferase n=1 Tax=Aureimonas glaciei TaxID=1776957 RepID=A0A916XTC6_9HYPH|nr:glycosyltransferase family 4 protein [Aureimonas glaciei]GGD06282.1 glycosyl transferase [Aureimonas glaciei]
MHLLFISSLLPDGNAASGFELANRAIVEEYRRQGVRLTLAGFRRPGSAAAAPGDIDLGELAIENAAVGRGRKLAWLAHALWAGLPISAAKLAVLDPRILRRRLAAAGPFDGYVLNSVQMPIAYPFLLADRPSVFIAHNVEHLSAEENARDARSWAARLLYRREARLLAISERRICGRAAVIHPLSRDDQRLLGLGQHPACHPLALSIGRSTLPDTGRRTQDIGLIGTWSWAPNRRGLDWFVEEVVKLLPADLRIAIAGRFDGPPPPAPANVRFVGRVEDAQAFIKASHVVALATRGGTGVQLKTIETFEEGMPAVATRAALRGVDHTPDNVRVADEAKDFAAALVAMVAGARAGTVRRGNGFAFMLGQRHALSAAVRRGLADLTALLEPAGRPLPPARTDDVGADTDGSVPAGMMRR